MHENVKEFMQGFRYDAHPMGMLLASVGALSTFYPEAAAIKDREVRYIQVIRLLAKMPTLAAFAYRHNRGMPYVYPDNDLSYAGNFLSMVYRIAELKYEPDPRIERALDVLFILHADHEQNCSASAVRSVGSSAAGRIRTSAITAGVGALHGAAARRRQRGRAANAAADREQGKHSRFHRGRKGVVTSDRWAFGHRVYKNF